MGDHTTEQLKAGAVSAATYREQRDALLDALKFAREKIADLHMEAGDGGCFYPVIDDAIDFSQREPK